MLFRSAGINDTASIKKMAMLANSVVLTSQGTAFMLAGEEFLRTKGGNHNSYNASYKVNELDYQLKVDNLDMFKNYQKLISMKTTFDALHFGKEDASKLVISAKDSNNVLQYTLRGEVTEAIVIHSNGVKPSSRSEIDLTGYKLYLDTLNGIPADTDLGKVTPQAFQTIIAYKIIAE